MADERHIFNPLDRVELGRSVGRAMLLSPCESLPPPEPFEGAGIYAIYYQGDFDAYVEIALPDCEWPIYVGRAMPPGGRRGLVGLDAPSGRVLFNRLRQHGRSISDVGKLRLEDFRCRYLIVDDIWIPLAERLLFGHYRPLWNGVVDGFGIHAPGRGRAEQARSAWDTLHPGRAFGAGRPAGESEAEVRERIARHVSLHPPQVGEPPDLEEAPPLDEPDEAE